MSIFFKKIQNTFKNQTKEFDFEKIGTHLKDKTFTFDSKCVDNNCFLSDNDENNFDLLSDYFKDNWLDKWKRKDYSYKNMEVSSLELEKAYKKFKASDDYLVKNIINKITENEWKNNWKNILRSNNNLEEIVFKTIFLPKRKHHYNNHPNKIEKYLKKYEKLFYFKSLSELNHSYDVFQNKIDCTNVVQGYLGTCYFLETISTLSNYGQLLFQLFPKEKYNPEGYYEICLFHEGIWQKVLVDDYFIFYKNNNDFAFTKPVKNCIFSCLLEKSFAKLKGSYADINGSFKCQAF